MLTTCLGLALLATTAAPDVAVVCPESLRPALAPWLAHRASQGRECQLVSADGTAAEIRGRILALASQGGLRFVVLVGDAPATDARGAGGFLPTRHVPTHHVPAEVVRRFGSEPDIAGDNQYADLDDDGLPDVAVGRFAVTSAAELGRLVARIIRYEQAAVAGAWRRRINLVAGLAGFGSVADAVIETAAKNILTTGIPAAYATTMTYASWRSPYCPDPRLFHAATVARLNEGCLFWVYLGHGRERVFDNVRAPDGSFHIFNVHDVDKLRAAAAPPIALLLCCQAGAFDKREDCLAEAMLRAEGGPVAAIAGSRVTMPYATAVLGMEMLREYFEGRRPTIGEVLLHAKRNTALRPRDDPSSQALDAAAVLLNPASADLAAERAEHVEIFNLLGDPLLQLPRAADVELDVVSTAAAGSTIGVTGTSPVDGQAHVELVVRRDRLAFRPRLRSQYASTPEARGEFQETYRRANDLALASAVTEVRGGTFRARLEVPGDCGGACHVRVFVEGPAGVALGASDVSVLPRPGAATVGVERP